eukprot:GHVL01007214.1.p1 GENE.GHVL01007214.1~~GHVL01007214.1.p1  ORF type:complete len:722 (+),score=221.69 GHVL01007214.1:25-2166(+)
MHCGIDLGAFHSVICASLVEEPNKVILQSNELSNRTTPSIVCIENRSRTIGETAESRLLAYPQGTIPCITSLVGLTTPEALKFIERFKLNFDIEPEKNNKNNFFIKLKFNDIDGLYNPILLLGIYIRILINNTYINTSTLKYNNIIISINNNFNNIQKASIIDACEIYGIFNVKIIYHYEALIACWVNRHLINIQNELTEIEKTELTETDMTDKNELKNKKEILLADFGYTHSSMTVLLVKKKDTENPDDVGVSVLSQRSVDLGVGDMIQRLADYVIKNFQKKNKKDVVITTKKRLRLEAECTKSLKLLSQLEESKIELENFVEDGVDATIVVHRSEFEGECAEILQNIKTALEDIKNTCEIDDVEVVGGGGRIPCIKALLETIFELPVKNTLDGSSSIAAGATLIANGTSHLKPSVVDPNLRLPSLEDLLKIEREMTEINNIETKRLCIRNDFESYIYKCRSVLSSPDRLLFKPTVTEPLLDTAQNWFDDTFYDDPTEDIYLLKMNELIDEIDKNTNEYKEKIEKDRMKIEKELEIAHDAQASVEKEDHDYRKLKTEERIRLANKNKEEGNDLFKETNFNSAIQRYLKALTHLEKSFDQSPSELAMIKDIRVACNLNLAQCYLSIGTEQSMKKAKSACDTVLELSDGNVKALYRRASAHEELGDLDKAEADLKKARELDPTNEGVTSSYHRVQKKQKNSEEKAKQVYSKMFS